MRVRWTPSAVADLEEISDYLFERNPQAAISVLQRVDESVATLKLFPNMGRPGRKKDTRELVVPTSPYLLVYQVADEILHILRVLHGAQYWPE